MAQTPEEPQQIQGVVERVIYSNAQNGYTVLNLNANGIMVTVTGNFGGAQPGETLSVTGHYTTHPKYGTQFQASSWEKSLPAETFYIEKFLANGAIPGVGPRLAQRIVNRFGDQTLDILANHPERLTEIRGITQTKSQNIAEAAKKLFILEDLMQFMKTYDLPVSYATKAYQKWGEYALETIQENPYALCSAGIDLPFPDTDRVAHALGQDENHTDRIQAGLEYILDDASTKGHTCLPQEVLLEQAATLLCAEKEDMVQVLAKALEDERFCAYTVDGTTYIYRAAAYEAESFIAEQLSLWVSMRADSNREALCALLDGLEQDTGISYADLQREAILTALSENVMLLTGGPGTGKTTTIRAILHLYEEQGYRVMLAAPTGRAAARMEELTGYPASTIHRLLGVSYDMSGNMVFLHDTGMPLECDVLVVDEMSMVDVDLFYHLLRALRLGSKLILVGDSNQLPSVGAGDLLQDLLQSGKIPTVCLEAIFRQSAQSRIVTNAHKIIHGEYPDLTAQKGDFGFYARQTPEEIQDLTVQLAAVLLPQKFHLDPYKDIQVITPARKGAVGVETLNTQLQEALNPPGPDKPEAHTLTCVFRLGDKIMQTKNNYDITWVKGEETGAGIFNGDIGTITGINLRTKEMSIDFEGKHTTYAWDQLDQIELAYAITVHKSQGNEFPVVLLPLSPNGSSRLYTRNLLYTAVTRAKKCLMIIGREDTIYNMVNRNVRARRYTCLQDMLAASEQEETT